MANLHHMLRALAEPTRLRILALLKGQEELCVCEIVDALRLPQYHVSRHLRALRAARLVCGRRQGRWMHYRLSPRMSREDRALVTTVCARARGEPQARAVLRRLQQCLRPREKPGCCISPRGRRQRES